MKVARHVVLAVFGAAGLSLFSMVWYGSSAISRSDDPPKFEGAMMQFIPYQESTPAPLTPILDAKGATLNLSDFGGKVVLLNFWATWCAPCVREMPSLDRLQAEMGSPRFVVVALSIDRGGLKTVMPFFEQLDLGSLAIYLDPQGKALKPFRVRGLPTSFIIDHLGKIRGEVAGPAEWDTDEAKALMRYYIEQMGNEIDKTDATDFEEYWSGAKHSAINVSPVHLINETAQASRLKRMSNEGGRHDAQTFKPA